MPLSRDEVIWLYRCILGRKPESEQVILDMMRSPSSFEETRASMIRTPEFTDTWFPGPTYTPVPSETPPPIRHPLLAVTAIMRNEESVIGNMLRSVAPIADFVILHDTGSTDNTVESAHETLESMGVEHQIHRTDFIDFANARNTLIDSIPDFVDWALMLDADETVEPEDHQRLIDLLKVDCPGWKLPRYNFIDPEKRLPPLGYPDFQARLFRHDATDRVRFAGAVHETPVGAGSWRAAPTNTIGVIGDRGGPHIHHMGHVIRSAQEYEEKVTWYAQLAAG